MDTERGAEQGEREGREQNKEATPATQQAIKATEVCDRHELWRCAWKMARASARATARAALTTALDGEKARRDDMRLR